MSSGHETRQRLTRGTSGNYWPWLARTSDTDEAVALRIMQHVDVAAGPTYGRSGNTCIRNRMPGFINAANHSPWLVIVDLNSDGDCVPPLSRSWVPAPSPNLLCFRMAVREVEAWLMGDADTLAKFLSVSAGRLPNDPESLPDPKQSMVEIARRSRKRAIWQDMCPRPGSGRVTDPAYTSRLIEYASTTWRPDVAAQSSPSLERALMCLERVRAAAANLAYGQSGDKP
jgi:hypothetical protein